MLTSVAISWDINVTKKEAEKILEYEELTVEFQGMCKVKTKVMRQIRQIEPFQNHYEKVGKHTGKTRD